MPARLITRPDGTQRLSVTAGWLVPLQNVREMRRRMWLVADGVPAFGFFDPDELRREELALVEQMERIRAHALEWAKRDAAEFAARPARPVVDSGQAQPARVGSPEGVTALQRLRAATFDVGAALGELIGCAPENLYAWRTVRMLVDIYVASEDLRMGPMRRKADGSPRERRPIGEACRTRGVSEHAVMNQINRARRRSSSTKTLVTTASAESKE